MEVVSHGPFRVLGLAWRPQRSAWAYTVIAKATYDLRPVVSPLADQQEDVNDGDNHWDDDPGRSVYAPSDVAPFKQGGDVVVVGDAYAPRGEPTRSVVARLVAAGIDKSIEIFGDRGFSASGVPREPATFVKMPLLYERAASGDDNPVGLGVDVGTNRRPAAPNLLPLGAVVASGQPPEPIGFGPIAPRWPTRGRLLGRAAAAWAEGGFEGVMPETFPAAFFNVAPADQQVEHLAADQHFALENLTAEHPLLVSNLPGVRPRAFVKRGDKLDEVALAADTLWIDTARQIATLVFRGHLAMASAVEASRVFVFAEEPSRPLVWADVLRACDAAGVAGLGGDRGLPRLVDEEEVAHEETANVDAGVVARSLARGPAFLKGLNPKGTVRIPPASSRSLASLVSLGRELAAKPTQPSEKWSEREETMPVGLTDPESHGTATELPPGLADASPPWLSTQPPEPVFTSIGVAPPAAISAPPPPSQVMVMPIAPPPVMGMHAPPPPPPPPPAIVGEVEHGSRDDGSPPPPPVAPSVLAMSNAAVSRAREGAAPPPAIDPKRIAAEREARPPPEVVELLWFDPDALEPIRKAPRWKDLVENLDPPKAQVPFDDEDVPPPDPPGLKDKRDLVGVMTLTSADGIDELDRLVDGAVSGGAFTPPLALLGGDLVFPFDELETLRATLTAVGPFTGSDKKLKELVDTAQELLKTTWVGSSSAVDGLIARVREQFGAQNRGLGPGHLDANTERILLEQRHFQRRTVFGDLHLRCLLGAPPVVVYLPDALASKLPMFQRLRCRVIAEVHLPQDQFESSALALRVVALARAFIRSPRRT